MIIIGADFHPEFQQIASVGTDTGEFPARRLGHITKQGNTLLRFLLRKSILQHEGQNQLRVLPIRLLLAHSSGSDFCRISDPEFNLQLRQQSVEPTRRPAGFHPYTHLLARGRQLAIEPLRFLAMPQPLFLVEAAQVTVRSDAEWRSKITWLMRRGRKIAKVAMARRLAVRLYWMWRKGWDYTQLKKFGSHAGQPGALRWCAVEHRVIDWVSRSSSRRSSK